MVLSLVSGTVALQRTAGLLGLSEESARPHHPLY